MKGTTIWSFLRGCAYIAIIVSTVAAVTTVDADNIMPTLALIGSLILMIIAEIQYDKALEQEYQTYMDHRIEEAYVECINYDIQLRRAQLIREYAGGDENV